MYPNRSKNSTTWQTQVKKNMHTDGDKIYAGLQRTIDQIFATVKTGWPYRKLPLTK